MTIQPPTDNLYKFMAIFGLILWIGGTFYPWTKAYELSREVIELEAQVAQAEKDPQEANSVTLRKNIELTRLSQKAAYAYFIIGGVCMFLGGLLMYYGFKWWYIRVQKPLDAQLVHSSASPTKPST